MTRFDWKQPLKLTILQMKIVGLWPQNQRYALNLYSLWALFIIAVFNFGHNFFQTINMVSIFDNLHALIQTFYVTLSELLALLKAVCIFKNMTVLRSLVNDVEQEVFQPKSSQIGIFEPSFRFWRINYQAYWTMSLGAIFFWSMYPILDNSGALPFLAWYPWDITKGFLFQFTYIYQILGLLCVATTAISTDIFIAALNVFLGAQLDILSDNIKRISGFEELLNCIHHHKEILRFSEQTNVFAGFVVLGQFFTSAVTIGITLFQLTVSVPFSSEFFSCVSFTLSMTLEIFMYCWFGNEVAIKSAQIKDAIFESPWIEQQSRTRKAIVFWLMKCQTPIKMSAFNLFYLSLDTFVRILRTAWSYFALLHQVSGKNV